MNTLTFLNQPLLWGLAAASIPLLIHLLFRRQYRRIDWAPMRYLKLSIQRNRRRVRIEQILLLLLRTALVMLLFFLVARPVMHAEGLSRLLGSNSRTNRIVLVDDSLSMGYTTEGRSALARGQDVLATLLPTFGSQDRLTVVLASAPRRPLLREVELTNVDDHVAVIRQVRPAEGFSAWEPILAGIDELIASGSIPLHEVTLVTDLRASGWETSLDELSSRWAASHVRLRVFDVGPVDTSNVALLSFEQVDRLALAGTPTRFEAQLRNDTGGELAGVEANFLVDGKATLVRVPTMAAGETIRLPAVAVFQEAGTHDVAFALGDDALPGDNQRWAVVHVQQGIDILLVDGEPSSEPLGSETDYLSLSLTLPGEAGEAFRVETLADSEWASTPRVNPDLLVLANVARLSADQVEQLERDVAAGMGLMIFVGDQTDPDNFNQVLFKNGAGLSPVALEGISDTEIAGMLIEAGEGSPLDAMRQLTPAALARIKVHKNYEVRLPQGEPDAVRVLSRWNNPSASGAVIQKVFERGNVLVWTTAADRGWSDWPTEASYVLAIREAARAVARSSATARQYSAGQPLEIALPASHDITLPAIETPGAKEAKTLVFAGAAPSGTAKADSAKAEAKRAKTLRYDDTARAGLYKMTWRDSTSGPMQESFAVNPDRRESQLDRLPVEGFKKQWGALEPEVVTIGASADTSLAVRGQEIWRTLATGLLGLLLVEACFARWAGRQR